MANAKLLEPIEGDEPCGADMRWDADFIQFIQDFEALKSHQNEGVGVIEGELAGSNILSAEEILNKAEDLCTKTKDLRVMALYVEGCWYDGGLGAFAEALEDLVTAIQTWPDINEGIYPRADEDDGDLSERLGPVSLLLRQIPALANTIGWGEKQPEISERQRISDILKGIFNSWSKDTGDAFEGDPPSCINALKSLKPFLDEGGAAPTEATAETGGEATMQVSADAWDLIERAAEVMALQDRHSPALPLLRLMSKWRVASLIEISDQMKVSGVTLEMFLESIKKQQMGIPGQPGQPAPGGAPSPQLQQQHPGLAR